MSYRQFLNPLYRHTYRKNNRKRLMYKMSCFSGNLHVFLQFTDKIQNSKKQIPYYYYEFFFNFEFLEIKIILQKTYLLKISQNIRKNRFKNTNIEICKKRKLLNIQLDVSKAK